LPLENWVHHSALWPFLYDWQALLTGIFALGAAFLAVRAAHGKERREVEAIRLSLAVEIRRLVNVLLQAHEAFALLSIKNQPPRADDVVDMISRGRPVVYPATADRVGLLGRMAPHVVMFYANLKDLEHSGRMSANPAGYVLPADLRALMNQIADACRRNVLPLLSELPPNTADPDTERKAKIEAM
jgi:hypothetical protein